MKKYLLFILMISAIISCKKYNEGGYHNISSRQPKRICGIWKLEQRLVNDVETPFDASIENYRLEFTKDAVYKETYRKNGTEVINEGTWGRDHGSDKYYINTASKGTIAIKILRLKSRQLWFTYYGFDEKTYEFHFKQE